MLIVFDRDLDFSFYSGIFSDLDEFTVQNDASQAKSDFQISKPKVFDIIGTCLDLFFPYTSRDVQNRVTKL